LLFQTNITGLKHFCVAKSLNFNPQKVFFKKNRAVFVEKQVLEQKLSFLVIFILLPWL
jgi:hypothetical protein